MKKNKLYTLVLLPVFIGLVFYGFITSLGPNDQTTVNGYLTNGGLVFSSSSVVNIPPQRDNIEYTANWSAGTNMPAPTRYHGSGAMWTNSTKDTSKLFCIGGDIDGSGNTSALVNIYNLTTNSWSAGTNVSAGRFYPSACRAGDSVYFFGGIGGTGGAFTQEVNTVDVYNVRTNTVTAGPVLPTTYADQRTITYQDSIIYVVGGLTGGSANATANVYLFNRQTATYRTATALPVARSSFAGVIVGDTMYVVCGGSAYGTGSNTMYIGAISQTNRATITWTTGTNYPGTSTERIYAEKWGCKGFITGCGSANGFTTSTECYVYNTNSHAWQVQTAATTPTSAYFSGSAPVGNSGITKWVVASGLILSPPYSIPQVQIFTDSLCGTAGGGSLCEGFTSSTFPPTGWTLTGAGSTYWLRNTVSGFGLGTGSAAYDMYNAPNGTVGNMNTFSFTPSVAGDSLKFDMAYCQWTSFPNDSLLILTSTNGGTTFTTLVAWGETQMNTAPSTCTHPFVPVASDWGRKLLPLPVGTNKITFSGHSGFGDDVYIDSVCVGHLLPVGLSHNQNGIPKVFALMQNYPNPFNPTTTIQYALPKSSNVEIKVYDLVGREVTTLVNEFKQAGYYSAEFNANNFASGVYFYRIKAGDFTDTKKMLLVK